MMNGEMFDELPETRVESLVVTFISLILLNWGPRTH